MRSAGISKAGVLEVTVVQAAGIGLRDGINFQSRRTGNYSASVTVEGAQQSTPVCYRTNNPIWESCSDPTSLNFNSNNGGLKKSVSNQSSKFGRRLKNGISRITSRRNETEMMETLDEIESPISEDSEYPTNSFLFSVMEFYGLSGIEIALYRHSILGRHIWATCEVPMHNALLSASSKRSSKNFVDSSKVVCARRSSLGCVISENSQERGWFRGSLFGSRRSSERLSDQPERRNSYQPKSIDLIGGSSTTSTQSNILSMCHDAWYPLVMANQTKVSEELSVPGEISTELCRSSKTPAVRLRLRFVPLRSCIGFSQSDSAPLSSSSAIGHSLRYIGQSYRTTAIHQAAMMGDVRLLKALIGMLESIYPGVKILAMRCEEGLTPLDHLIRGHHIRGVKLLLKSFGKMCLDGLESGCSTPFHTAVNSNEPNVLPLLAAAVKQHDKRTDRHGTLFSEWGTSYNSNASVPQRPPIVDITNEDGMTALCMACKMGESLLCRLLIRFCGANISLPDFSGVTPLMHAASGGYLDIVADLISVVRDSNAAHSLIPSSMQRTSTLASMACDPCNADKEKGRTALALAAAKGHVEVVDTLIKAGIPFKIRDSYSQTPLHIAAEAGHFEVVQLLVGQLDHEDFSLTAENGTIGASLLHSSQSNSLMLQGGPFRISSQDANGQSAEALARMRGHTEIADYLKTCKSLDVSRVATLHPRSKITRPDSQSSYIGSSNSSMICSEAEYLYPCEENV